MINYWMCSEEFPIVDWTVRFTDNKVEVERLLTLIDELVRAAEKEQIGVVESASLMPTMKHKLPRFVKQDTYSYKDFAEYIIREYKHLPLFAFSGYPSSYDRVESRVCFFENGEKVNRKVNDLGEALRKASSSPTEIEMSTERDLTATSHPMFFFGGVYPVSLNMAHEPYEPIELTITTNSDIWFPYVLGWREKSLQQRYSQIKKGDLSAYRDNRELAQCHTPRLNNFLQHIKEVAVDIGAKWDVEPLLKVKGLEQFITSDGIKLE